MSQVDTKPPVEVKPAAPVAPAAPASKIAVASSAVPAMDNVQWEPRVRDWTRKRMLIDYRYQLPGSLLAVAVAVVLLVLLNASFYFLSTAGRRDLVEMAPQVQQQLVHSDHVTAALLVGCSVLLLAGVYAMGIVATHRTAGPAYRIRTNMKRVEAGHYCCEVKLRKYDNLQNLGDEFNVMLRGLQHHTVEDASALEALAVKARTLSPAPQAEALASEIERLIRQKEQRLSS